MNSKFFIALIAILAVVSLITLVYWQNEDGTNTTSVKTYIPNRAEVHEAALGLLAAAPDIVRIESAFLTIEPGQDGNSWSVRGTFNKENRNIALFAAIRYHCASREETEQCWSLDELIIDGIHSPIATLSTGSSERSSVSGPMNTTTLQFTDSRQLPSTLKTQAISERTAAVRLQSHSQTKLIRSTTKNQANANAAQKTPSSKSATASTWRTRSDNVNARSGPGLDTNIIFKMNTSIPLMLIEQQELWGLFEYTAANRKRGHVWIHMNMVEKAGE